MPSPHEEFAQIVNGLDMENPYGGPVQAAKPGLTKRGKMALGIGATVIAGGGLIGYQVHATNEVKAQEIALKAQTLELQKMKWQNQVNEAGRKEQNNQAKARQASIDTCVKSHDDQVGKVLGTTYRDVVEACQTQYPDTLSGSDMESAASSQTADDNGGGGVNQGLLVGGGALVLFLVYAAKKGTRSNPA